MTKSRLRMPQDWKVPGFSAAAAAADVKGKGTGDKGRLDMGLILCREGTAVAGVFTRNRMAAAPVLLCRERVSSGRARAVLVNSGNANCMTGKAGYADARMLCRRTAGLLSVPERQVFPSSTGVIGVPLPAARMAEVLPGLVSSLSPEGMEAFSRAILTTDTRPKAALATVSLSGGDCRILGVAKGAGMIAPDMATMLCYVLTDASVPPSILARLLRPAVRDSFNAARVDGDTSTNDTALLLASGAGPRLAGGADRDAFARALAGVCLVLAEDMVADGEGATRVVLFRVTGARTDAEARRAARAVADSLLVKTALAAGDPNWGRMAAAVGCSGAETSPGRFSLRIEDLPVVEKGEPVRGYDEKAAAALMAGDRFTVHISIGRGGGEAEVLTCDLTEDYVRINKDYRS